MIESGSPAPGDEIPIEEGADTGGPGQRRCKVGYPLPIKASAGGGARA